MRELAQQQGWLLTTNDAGLLTLSLDCTDASANTLSQSVLDGLTSMIEQISIAQASGLILTSGKSSGFIAGADIHDFTTIHDVDAAYNYMRQAQALFDQFEALPCRTIALIDGFCLGGGLELALACDVRLASDDARTTLGFPEVKLGIHPGFGGTMRACRRCGAWSALPLMLQGKQISARRARAIGLVDAVMPARHLQRAVEYWMEQPVPQPSWWQRWSNHALLRPLTAKFLQRQVRQRVDEAHYPAPFALLRLWCKHGDQARTMLDEEARSVARLINGATAQQLIRAFLLRQQLKDLGKNSSHKAQHVHVVGAGVMGGDIAAWCALRGLHVTLQDQSAERIAPAIGRAAAMFRRQLKDEPAIQAAMDRLLPDVAGRGVAKADVIIEAVFEDLGVKQQLFLALEAQARHDALLATNTSSIPLQAIASVLQQPERLVGLHFFNPVARMALIEVVHNGAEHRHSQAVTQALAMANQLGKLPLPVASHPGFLVNRILMPYLMQAMMMVDEGIAIASIDRIATDWGMPMGPLLLADHVGLDVCQHVATVLTEALGYSMPASLSQRVNAGELGKKTERGFYGHPLKRNLPFEYDKQSNSLNDADIRDRLVYSMLNESVACLSEGVVASADLCDAGMIFGTGFAPFRGGPMQFIQQQGVAACVQRLEQLRRYDEKVFTPHPGWRELPASEAGDGV
jgi:3-hydroxyacyl-CoA dehydrogenase/enoyl-CoA hydratase/3-hydroxybutyryl-CoA epimerase